MSKGSQGTTYKYLKVNCIKDVNNFSGVFGMIELKIMVGRSRVKPWLPWENYIKWEYLNQQETQK